MNHSIGPVYINKPINKVEDDFLGVTLYCKKIIDAINKGANMIALTSSFGTGKSSIISLLEHNSKLCAGRIVVKISFWPKLCEESGKKIVREIDLNELHSFFICNLARGMKLDNYEYIEEKLNVNYGLLRFNTENYKQKILLMVTTIVFIISLILDFIDIDIFGIDVDKMGIIFSVLSAFLFAYLLTKSDIVFSSQKSEGKKVLMPHEILEIYNKYILNNDDNHRYLVVIEDLDRSNNNNLVAQFLKELRKYYVEGRNNKIAFLINIKPESEIISEESDVEYLKIFDYIIDLPKIDVNNYDSILESLLNNQKDEIYKLLGKKDASLKNMPQMEWIIRGNDLNIRKIKDRLNKTFILYENLKEKFNDSIDNERLLEKCAAAVYLKTEFELEFSVTPDDAFEKLIDEHINGSQYTDISLEKGNVGEYNETVKNLISGGLIDYDYREYYTNYPKGAKVYKAFEKRIADTILYNRLSANIDDDIDKCLKDGSTIFEESFKRISKLNIPINIKVALNQRLLTFALNYAPEQVYLYIKDINYSNGNDSDLINELVTIVKNSIDSENYINDVINKYTQIWMDKCSVEQIQLLREKLCKISNVGIKNYKDLFNSPYKIISKEEIDSVSLDETLYLSLSRNSHYSNELINNILNVAEKNRNVLNDSMLSLIKDLINKVYKENSSYISSIDYINFMDLNDRLIPEYENLIIEDCKNNDEINVMYQNLVNKYVLTNKISEKTAETIYKIDKHAGYNEKVSEMLYNSGYIYDSSMICVINNYDFDMLNDDIVNSLINNKEYVLNNIEYLNKLRSLIINKGKNCIEKYKDFFDKTSPIVDENQLIKIFDCLGISEGIDYINFSEMDNIIAEKFIEKINSIDPSESDVYKLLSSFKNWPKNIIKENFEKLDLKNKYCYSKLNDEQILSLRNDFVPVYTLTTVNGMTEYSRITSFLDKNLDELVSKNISNGKIIGVIAEETYVSLLKEVKVESITSTTINNISKIKDYEYTEQLEKMLFDNSIYSKYIVSRALRQKCFELENDKIDILWNSYIDVYNKSKEEIYIYMSSNQEFLKKIIEQKSYVDLSDEKLLTLSSVYQTNEILDYISKNKDEIFITNYLRQIAGFENKDAAILVLDVISNNEKLVLDEEIHNNINDKLIDRGLKGRYTKIINICKGKQL